MHSGLKMIAALLCVVIEAKHAPIVRRDASIFPVPKACRGDFCFVKFNEPQQKFIDKIIEKVAITTYTRKSNSSLWYGEREGADDVQNHKLCKSRAEFRLAYYIKDVEDEWRVVIQSNTIFIQSIQMEHCSEPGLLRTASLDTNLIPESIFETYKQNNIFMYCDTEYFVDYQYWVLTKNLTSVELVKTKKGVPVACNCILSQKIRD